MIGAAGWSVARNRHVVRIGWAMVLAFTLGLLATPMASAATPADVAATHALLQANYELDSAWLQNAADSVSAATAFTQQVSQECHGVLTGAPKEDSPHEFDLPPRARGERARSRLQMQTIQYELERSLSAASSLPDREALEAYSAKISSLSWSDPRIVPLVSLRASSEQEDLTSGVADVCADMRFWERSGYHRLSLASQAFAAARNARAEATRPAGSLSVLLKPDEGPAERMILHRVDALRTRIEKAFERVVRVDSKLQSELGLPPNPFEARRRAVVIGRVETASGETATIHPDTEKSIPPGKRCGHSLSVEFESHRKHSGASFFTGSSSSTCLSGPGSRRPSGSCSELNEQLTLAVPHTVSAVRLRLSNGATVTSRVVPIPRRYGGPVGIYVQSIRDLRSYPVALLELDAHGAVVRTVPIPKYMRCEREPKPQGPTFVDLAHGSTPEGEPFTIQGVLVQFGKHTDFSLSLGPEGPERAGEGESRIEVGPGSHKAFELSLANGCAPHPYAILYGILAAPGAAVLVRTSEGLVALTKVEIAAGLHSGGPLFYGAFRAIPSEVIVRRSDGSTLYSESLVARVKEETEFCEGYAEG